MHGSTGAHVSRRRTVSVQCSVSNPPKNWCECRKVGITGLKSNHRLTGKYAHCLHYLHFTGIKIPVWLSEVKRRCTLLEMRWAEHTYKWLEHTKFLAHLAVSSLSVCTAHHLVYSTHQLAKIQHTSYDGVCTNHHPSSGCSTLYNAGVHQPPSIKWL